VRRSCRSNRYSKWRARAKRSGCKEALFTLGEKPELRYKAARDALAQMGYATTLEYLHAAAKAVLDETGLLPHANPGTMTDDELALLRQVSPSMGIMLETASARLGEKGMPHYGSPDKVPEVRLDTLRRAGAARVPFTSGILIGIGESRLERIESLLALRGIHAEHGHIQEIIVQNFRAKEGTKMRHAPEPDLDELLWTIAVARIIFGPEMSIQAPPNLSPGVLPQIVAAGHQRLGRRFTADAGLRQSRGAVAAPRRTRPGNGARRETAARTVDDLSEVRPTS
jgi:FO synthase